MTFHRYVALGDSFTEGVGDPDPDAPQRPAGLGRPRRRGARAGQRPDFGYANLAIRGRKLRAILDEQLEPALALEPDLVTIYAGGNDILRPRVDIDALIARYDDALGRLAAPARTSCVFTAFDPGRLGVFRPMRGRFALYNEGVREIAERHDATLVDFWRMREYRDGVMDTDRMHLGAGRDTSGWRWRVLDALGIDARPGTALPRAAPPGRRDRRAACENLRWTREFLAPWVHRRVTGRSSGDKSPPSGPVWPRSTDGRTAPDDGQVRFRRILRM